MLRVHAILVRRYSPVPQAPLAQAAAPQGVSELRARAVELLRVALGGDALAAEYVLLQALARVAARWVCMARGSSGVRRCASWCAHGGVLRKGAPCPCTPTCANPECTSAFHGHGHRQCTSHSPLPCRPGPGQAVGNIPLNLTHCPAGPRPAAATPAAASAAPAASAGPSSFALALQTALSHLLPLVRDAQRVCSHARRR